MHNLISFYLAQSFLMKMVICIVLLVVAFAIAYLCMTLISKHMTKKKKQLDEVRKHGSIRR